ncbi:MAG: type IV pilin protein [Candidatus Saccharimonadales bacterium]
MNISRWARTQTSGFTIVELLIVIVVIAILAAISLVAFGAVQGRARVASLQSDLASTAKLMKMEHSKTGVYPGVLPAEVRPSPGVTLTLVSTPGGYSGLSAVQNGVLFQSVCQSLINEGLGRSINNGGQNEQYITGCNVYNHNTMQINGWSAHDFQTPVSTTSVSSWYNTHVAHDSWRPDKKQAFLTFATELSERFIESGGRFPVTSFWDSWANSTNGGVLRESLPAPSSGASDIAFCIEATHLAIPAQPWHLRETGKPTQGTC